MNPVVLSNPLVSIIVPFYNVERYLAEAVESVLAQTYLNWELILVNDGSVDGSARVAKEFVRGNRGKISCVSHVGGVNRGASASRNLGLSRAGGDCIAFLDSDDWWFPDKLEQQVDILSRFPQAEVICGASLYWESWAPGEGWDRTVEVGCRQNALYDPPDLMTVLYPLGQGSAPCMNGLLLTRSALAKTGGFVDGFRGMYDDQVILTKIYLSCSVYITDRIFDKYRQNREGSICYLSRRSRDYYVYRSRYLAWLKIYMEENEIRSSPVEERLELELSKCRVAKPVGRGRSRISRMKARIKSALGWVSTAVKVGG